MATENSREARRRKILERGSDRLAFITGQAQSLPPSTVATPPPPPKWGGGEVEEPVPDIVGPTGDDVVIGYELSKCEPSSATVRDTTDRSAGCETFTECEKSNEAVDTMQHNTEQIEPVTVRASFDQGVSTEPRGKRQTHEMFTSMRISSSISASENIRMLCASFIAVLVVLSYHGYPVGGEALGSVISFRPIFLVLLTDASLVFGILFATGWEEKDEADAGRTGQQSKDWADQMSKVLEVVVALQKMASTAFLDCCLCAVIIICGISLSTIPQG